MSENSLGENSLVKNFLALTTREKNADRLEKSRRGEQTSFVLCSCSFFLSPSLSLSLYRSTMAAATWRGALSRNMQELR